MQKPSPINASLINKSRPLHTTLMLWIAILWLPLSLSNVAAAATSDILIVGDSISAGYGLPRERGWVTLLQNRLQQQGINHTVINASISGETTEGGRNRLPALLEKYRPAIVVVELGGNDGLRGFQIDRLRSNLNEMVQNAQAIGAKVLLLGMKIPPNYGLRYTSDFYASFTTAAQKFDVPLVPFFLEGVAAHPELIQEDGIHPTADAQARLLENVWPYLKPLL
jgi:acyl-CoA thioesterase-1